MTLIEKLMCAKYNIEPGITWITTLRISTSPMYKLSAIPRPFLNLMPVMPLAHHTKHSAFLIQVWLHTFALWMKYVPSYRICNYTLLYHVLPESQ